MVSYGLGKEKEEDTFCLAMIECGNKEKFWVLKTICCLICWNQSDLFTHQTNSNNKEADTLDGQMSCAFFLFFLFLSKIKNNRMDYKRWLKSNFFLFFQYIIQHRSWRTDHAYQITLITSWNYSQTEQSENSYNNNNIELFSHRMDKITPPYYLE